MSDGYYILNEDEGTWYDGKGGWTHHIYFAFCYDTPEHARTGCVPFRNHKCRIILAAVTY